MIMHALDHAIHLSRHNPLDLLSKKSVKNSTAVPGCLLAGPSFRLGTRAAQQPIFRTEHENQQEYDRARSGVINTYNIEIMRFKNEEVLNQLPKVLTEIDRACHERLPFPPPEGVGG